MTALEGCLGSVRVLCQQIGAMLQFLKQVLPTGKYESVSGSLRGGISGTAILVVEAADMVFIFFGTNGHT